MKVKVTTKDPVVDVRQHTLTVKADIHTLDVIGRALEFVANSYPQKATHPDNRNSEGSIRTAAGILYEVAWEIEDAPKRGRP